MASGYLPFPTVDINHRIESQDLFNNIVRQVIRETTDQPEVKKLPKARSNQNPPKKRKKRAYTFEDQPSSGAAKKSKNQKPRLKQLEKKESKRYIEISRPVKKSKEKTRKKIQKQSSEDEEEFQREDYKIQEEDTTEEEDGEEEEDREEDGEEDDDDEINVENFI
jgi:hypothetical protein|tara:strand:- start:44 stop:538 length:495 start_codon:yes stop_codon:yes gene_type:complete